MIDFNCKAGFQKTGTSGTVKCLLSGLMPLFSKLNELCIALMVILLIASTSAARAEYVSKVVFSIIDPKLCVMDWGVDDSENVYIFDNHQKFLNAYDKSGKIKYTKHFNYDVMNYAIAVNPNGRLFFYSEKPGQLATLYNADGNVIEKDIITNSRDSLCYYDGAVYSNETGGMIFRDKMGIEPEQKYERNALVEESVMVKRGVWKYFLKFKNMKKIEIQRKINEYWLAGIEGYDFTGNVYLRYCEQTDFLFNKYPDLLPEEFYPLRNNIIYIMKLKNRKIIDKIELGNEGNAGCQVISNPYNRNIYVLKYERDHNRTVITKWSSK